MPIQDSSKSGLGGAVTGSVTVAIQAPPGGLFHATGTERSLGLYLSATVIFRLLNLGRIWFLAWCMPLGDMGLLNMILMYVSVFVPLCSLGLTDAIARYTPLHETRGTLAAFLRRAGVLIASVTMGTIGLMVAFSHVIADGLFTQGMTKPAETVTVESSAMVLVIATGCAVALSVFQFALIAVFRGLRMFRAISWMEISHAFLFLAGSAGMFLAGRATAIPLTCVFSASLLAPILFFGVGLANRIKSWSGQGAPLEESGWERRLLRFSLWTMLSGVTWQALQYYSTWYLHRIHGAESVAIFTTVQKIAQMVLIGAVAVSMVTMTAVTKSWETEGREAAERKLSLAFRGTGIGLFMICAILALLKDVVMMLFRSEYASGAEIMPLQLLFFLLAGFLAFLPGYFSLREKTRFAFWAWTAGIVGNVVLAGALASPGVAPTSGSLLPKPLMAVVEAVFRPGFADALGLHAASWCAVGAMSLAVGVCILLLRVEGVRLSRGMVVVIGASGLLAFRPEVLATGTSFLLAASLFTDLIFEKAERRQIFNHVTGAWGHVPKPWPRGDRGGVR